MEVWLQFSFCVFASAQIYQDSFLLRMSCFPVWPLLALLFHTISLGSATSVIVGPDLPADTAASVLLRPALQVNYSIPIDLLHRHVATSSNLLCYSQSLC